MDFTQQRQETQMTVFITETDWDKNIPRPVSR